MFFEIVIPRWFGAFSSKLDVVTKFQGEITVSSSREAEIFHCQELNLFEFYQDYGMENISLVLKNNRSVSLLLKEGVNKTINAPIFSIEVNSCDEIFNYLKGTLSNSNGRLLNDEVFEYPLGKNITLKDPSGNMFLLFEDYKG